MNKVKTLIRKELLDILRDKKTLVIMVAVPVLLYPLLIIGMSLLMMTFLAPQEHAVYTIGYPLQYEELARRLEDLYVDQQNDQEIELRFLSASSEEMEQISQLADVWLEPEKASDGRWHVKIDYTSTDSASRNACGTVEDLLEDYRKELLTQNLKREGLEESFLYPITYEENDGASISESFGMDIGGSIGMMLIITILLGAVYPAIDATAGEKERGTLETLLTLPVTNFQMILSKYIAVSVIACVTAILSVLSLGGSVLFLMFGLSSELAGEMQGISFSALLAAIPFLLLTLMVTALLSTAICMCFCVFAKSFKEANNYITPVLLVVMFAAMAGMVPSVTLNYRTALIPIVNVSLMTKQIISQQFDLALAGITIGVNFGCSILIIWLLAKMYDSENVLFQDGFRSFRLFQRRSDIQRGTIPDTGDLVISFTVLFMLLLYVGTVAAVRLGFWGTAVSQLLIFGVPLIVVWYMKCDVKELFSLRLPKRGSVLGSVLLYAGTYCLMLCLASSLTRLLPESAQNVEGVFLPMAEQSLPILLFVTALMPAVGEEILFRGFLFGSLRANFASKGYRKAAMAAVLLSAVVFGMFHTSLIRFLPTFLLGAAFAYIVSVSGSICLTMLLHFVNNALSMLTLKYPHRAAQIAPFLVQETLSGGQLAIGILIGLVCAGTGLVLLRRVK